MNFVVVVESPAKAKTIEKYLGEGYLVIASYGHIRDLPAKDGSVRPDEDFSMDWEVDDKSEKHIRDIASALRNAERLYLATDPDREGEAISWHVQEELQNRKALDGIEVKRVTFNEITKDAVLTAMRNPRDVDGELVDAYLARRALDYLVGFTLSPVLWRKLPGSRSAGRVQSVALRLICEREGEVERFRSREYWTVEADFLTIQGTPLTTHLTHLAGKKLDKFDLPDETTALAAKAQVETGSFTVSSVERKKTRRFPAPPFTTSTLQQEASRKLHYAAKRTMQIAQRLYEGVEVEGETVGLITYMRTDGVQMAAEAIQAVREMIGERFGKPYLPGTPRLYKTKAKNAQEAHEAIRPTDVYRRPEDVAPFLDRDHLRLYELVWKRTVASQMECAELEQVAVDVIREDGAATLRATGSIVVFDGFLKLYREDRDDEGSGDDDTDRILPAVGEGDALRPGQVRPEQHFTQPPPRYSEASLVKKLEELGIGRPSTYANIIAVLQDRNYVRIDARRFIPEDRGRLVTAFLESFFNRYVQYNFTAELENQLDEISGGRIDWKTVLRGFWEDFHGAVDGTRELRVSQVLDALDQDLGPHFFPEDVSGKDPRVCPTCGEGRLGLRLSKFGAFIGCSQYPTCRYTRPLTVASEGGAEMAEAARELGCDSATGGLVSLRKGPYGIYVQLDPPASAVPAPPANATPEPPPEPADGKPKKARKTRKTTDAPKPKRVSLPKGFDPASVDLDRALQLLALPREIGSHPESNVLITVGVGRFGPYLKCGDVYTSLPAEDDVLTVGMNRAVDLLANGGKARAPGRALGDHPDTGKPVTVRAGRFGPYVKCGDLMATLPKGADPETISLAEALEILKAKAAKGKPAKGGKSAKGAKPVKAAKATKSDDAVAKEEMSPGTATKKSAPKAKSQAAKGGGQS
ncbi:MAG: type I DNA topoisomerase [Alphaproteobacteria bacterium]|nr:type I DNA topoisomerase [Alphaproteobacteria bacterium]